MKKREAPGLACPGPTPEQWRSCGHWSGRQVFQLLELKEHRDGRNRCREAEQGSGGRIPNGAEVALPGAQLARSNQFLRSMRKRVSFTVSPISSAKATLSKRHSPTSRPNANALVPSQLFAGEAANPGQRLPRKYTFVIYLCCRLNAFRQTFTHFVFTSKIKGFADTSALNARG